MKSIRIIKERIKNYNKLADDFINPINKKSRITFMEIKNWIQKNILNI
jgi:hypothetical protein